MVNISKDGRFLPKTKRAEIVNCIKSVFMEDKNTTHVEILAKLNKLSGVRYAVPPVRFINRVKKELGLLENQEMEIKDFLLKGPVTNHKAAPVSDAPLAVAVQVVDAVKALKRAMKLHGVSEITVTCEKTEIKLTHEITLDF